MVLSHCRHVYWVCPEGIARKNSILHGGAWQMGNRVMERPNLSGGTVARHHTPKAVRRSRKRALRKIAGALKPAEPAEALNQTMAPQVASKAPKPRKLIERPSRKPVVQLAAKVPTPVTPIAQPSPKPVPQIAAKAPKPVKPIERPSEKPAAQIAARARTPEKPIELPSPKPIEVPVKAPKPVTLFERLTKRRAARKAPEAQKPEEPALPAPPPVQEPAAEKARRMPVDTFEDGAIEWGIKREGEGKEPKDSGT